VVNVRDDRETGFRIRSASQVAAAATMVRHGHRRHRRRRHRLMRPKDCPPAAFVRPQAAQVSSVRFGQWAGLGLAWLGLAQLGRAGGRRFLDTRGKGGKESQVQNPWRRAPTRINYRGPKKSFSLRIFGESITKVEIDAWAFILRLIPRSTRRSGHAFFK
jgi:hypothetical protein